MVYQIDRNRKLILLRWLQQGYIETDDLPEMSKTNYFEELLIYSTFDDEDSD